MLPLRRLWTVFVGVWGCMLAAGLLLVQLLDLHGPLVAAAIVLAGVLGGVASFGEAREVEPMAPKERRDAVLGWGGLVGGVAAVACLFAPMPWGALAAVAVVAVTVLALRRYAPS